MPIASDSFLDPRLREDDLLDFIRVYLRSSAVPDAYFIGG
jgi:hypothetical protein